MIGGDADMAISLAQQGPIIIRAVCAVPVLPTNTCESSVRTACVSSDAVNAARPVHGDTRKPSWQWQGHRAVQFHGFIDLPATLVLLYLV